MAVEPQKQMGELVGEHPAERGPERVFVDRRYVDRVPVAGYRSRDLSLPERDPARFDLRVTEPVVVPVAAASRDDGLSRFVEHDDDDRPIAHGLVGGDAPVQPYPAGFEEPVDFGESAFHNRLGKWCADVDRNVNLDLDGEQRRDEPERLHGFRSYVPEELDAIERQTCFFRVVHPSRCGDLPSI
jgi:hypothetical protein